MAPPTCRSCLCSIRATKGVDRRGEQEKKLLNFLSVFKIKNFIDKRPNILKNIFDLLEKSGIAMQEAGRQTRSKIYR